MLICLKSDMWNEPLYFECGLSVFFSVRAGSRIGSGIWTTSTTHSVPFSRLLLSYSLCFSLSCSLNDDSGFESMGCICKKNHCCQYCTALVSNLYLFSVCLTCWRSLWPILSLSYDSPSCLILPVCCVNVSWFPSNVIESPVVHSRTLLHLFPRPSAGQFRSIREPHGHLSGRPQLLGQVGQEGRDRHGNSQWQSKCWQADHSQQHVFLMCSHKIQTK